MMTKQQMVLTELQMVTGVVTDDINYLMYLVLKDGSFFQKETAGSSKFVLSTNTPELSGVESLDDWFAKL